MAGVVGVREVERHLAVDHHGQRQASGIADGQTDCGKVFFYSSCPSAIIGDLTASLSTLPPWLGKQ